MVSLSSTAQMLGAMSTARRVTFSAYVMGARTPVARALEAAAARGAHVTVRLNGYFDKHTGTKAMLEANRGAVRALKHAHVDAKLMPRRASDGPALHLKACVCDGAAFLCDRNWSKSEDTVIRDDTSRDVGAVRRAASYTAQPSGAIQFDKKSGLEAEGGLLRTAHGDRIAVQTESIGFSNPVYSALLNLAKSGKNPRLLISTYGNRGASLHAVTCLERAGVRVRVTSSCEKFAVTGSGRAWIGSVNATSPYFNADEIDWGLCSRDSHLVHALETRFSAAWRNARPL